MVLATHIPTGASCSWRGPSADGVLCRCGLGSSCTGSHHAAEHGTQHAHHADSETDPERLYPESGGLSATAAGRAPQMGSFNKKACTRCLRQLEEVPHCGQVAACSRVRLARRSAAVLHEGISFPPIRAVLPQDRRHAQVGVLPTPIRPRQRRHANADTIHPAPTPADPTQQPGRRAHHPTTSLPRQRRVLRRPPAVGIGRNSALGSPEQSVGRDPRGAERSPGAKSGCRRMADPSLRRMSARGRRCRCQRPRRATAARRDRLHHELFNNTMENHDRMVAWWKELGGTHRSRVGGLFKEARMSRLILLADQLVLSPPWASRRRWPRMSGFWWRWVVLVGFECPPSSSIGASPVSSADCASCHGRWW
jgi:hypothetical protein